MLFKASDMQAKKVAREALDASGFKVALKKIDIDQAGPRAGIFIDRMGSANVNLKLKKVAEGLWHFPDSEPAKTTAWLGKFGGYEKMVKTVDGTEVFKLLNHRKTDKLKAPEPKVEEAAEKTVEEAPEVVEATPTTKKKKKR